MKRIAPDRDARFDVTVVGRRPPGRRAEDRASRRRPGRCAASRRRASRRRSRASSVAMPMSRSNTRIAIETPQPRNSGPRYFAFARSDHGRVCAITSAVSARYDAMNSTTKQLDHFDRLELNRPEPNPQPRAVDFLAEQRERDEQHDRAQNPDVLVRRQHAKAREGRSRRDRQHQRERQPHDLPLSQTGLEPRDHGQTDRREQRPRAPAACRRGSRRRAQHRPGQRQRAQRERQPAGTASPAARAAASAPRARARRPSARTRAARVSASARCTRQRSRTSRAAARSRRSPRPASR